MEGMNAIPAQLARHNFTAREYRSRLGTCGLYRYVERMARLSFYIRLGIRGPSGGWLKLYLAVTIGGKRWGELGWGVEEGKEVSLLYLHYGDIIILLLACTKHIILIILILY